MSLILDALRRADAERGRGAVPGLHTPQAMTPLALEEAPSRLPAMAAVALGAMVAAGGGVYWWQSRADRPADSRVVLAPVPVTPPAPVPAVVAPTPAQQPVEEAPPPLKLLPPREPVVSAPVAPVAVPPSRPARAPQLQELPAAARQQLPQLAVAGASYSANPAYRMVIVNGQVLHEGDEAAKGVVLESIAERSVVLRGLGQRWSVPY